MQQPTCGVCDGDDGGGGGDGRNGGSAGEPRLYDVVSHPYLPG